MPTQRRFKRRRGFSCHRLSACHQIGAEIPVAPLDFPVATHDRVKSAEFQSCTRHLPRVGLQCRLGRQPAVLAKPGI